MGVQTMLGRDPKTVVEVSVLSCKGCEIGVIYAKNPLTNTIASHGKQK